MFLNRRWPWVAQQNWQDILFIHTPVTHETIRPFVPYPFEIDMHNNMGWVSIVLFRATHSRLRFMPAFLSFPQFYQMNIRTYVRFGNERGIYFFTIYVDNPIVKLGGNITGLPFTDAQMTFRKETDKYLFKTNQLVDNSQSGFSVSYEPGLHITSPHIDSLPHFLLERYSIWMIKGNMIVKAPIFHTHWNLKDANISAYGYKHIPFFTTDNITAHYADFKHAIIYPFEKVGKVYQDGEQ